MQDKKLTVNLSEANACRKIGDYILFLITRQERFLTRPLVLLCIGSDRYTGDALGPLIGSYLIERTNCIVYGSLDYPVHAGNLVETINLIDSRHQQPVIIAIDASLGKHNEIGNIEVWEGGLDAGIAVGNRLPRIGHISIIGVVNASGHIGYLDLQSTPLSIVMKLTRVIATALEDAINTVSSPADLISNGQ